MLEKNDGPWYYEQQLLGYNYRITDIQCALGISQMRKLDRFVARRRELAKRYTEAFSDCENLVTPYQLEGSDSAWHLYIIQVLHRDRKIVFEKLKEQGIGANVHYIPVYKHPYYQENGYRDVYCEKAENLYQHMITIPLFPLLSDEEQERVIDWIKDIYMKK